MLTLLKKQNCVLLVPGHILGGVVQPSAPDLPSQTYSFFNLHFQYAYEFGSHGLGEIRFAVHNNLFLINLLIDVSFSVIIVLLSNDLKPFDHIIFCLGEGSPEKSCCQWILSVYPQS